MLARGRGTVTVNATSTRFIYLFANDVEFNSGQFHLTVTEREDMTAIRCVIIPVFVHYTSARGQKLQQRVTCVITRSPH